MSLKAFHILFIAASILLGMLVGGWGVQRWVEAGEAGSLAVGLVFFASAAVLLWYGLRFLRKVEELGL